MPPPKWVSQVLDEQDKDHLDKELDFIFRAMDKKNEGKVDEEDAEEEAVVRRKDTLIKSHRFGKITPGLLINHPWPSNQSPLAF